MGWIGPFLLGEDDEIAIKKLMALYEINYEKAKEIHIEIKNKLENI